MIVYYIIGGLTIILFMYVFLIYNSFVKVSNKVREAFSTMDIYLKKRWDLIPNLVQVVKGYAAHEKDTFESVINLRNGNYDDLSIDEKINTNEQIHKAISKIMVLAENYPELKANENFLNLSRELTKVEDEIASSRKYYNAIVRILNNKVEMFPSNFVASMFNYQKQKMFEATDNERQNVKVELS